MLYVPGKFMPYSRNIVCTSKDMNKIYWFSMLLLLYYVSVSKNNIFLSNVFKIFISLIQYTFGCFLCLVGEYIYIIISI